MYSVKWHNVKESDALAYNIRMALLLKIRVG